MKLKLISFVLLMFTILSFGCARNINPTPVPGTTKDQTNTQAQYQTPLQAQDQGKAQENKTDVVTTASVVDNAAAFEKAISNKGTWIIAIVKDLTINKDLVLDGEFKNGKKDKDGKDIVQRKVALYTQDENRNVTNRFTLTAPKFTINSPKASIQHGTFKGDLYVSAKDFELIDATVNGNVYFTNNDAKSTFKMDDKSKITGKQELKK
ncbi:hypothetical protein [Clostridium pascui]|uniref:hypothetical protein n=1 Tax=Clostridium pascui TaxID=46609 RepID=UPI00195EB371|nr:hypothetical protein [Clostridium pascui]